MAHGSALVSASGEAGHGPASLCGVWPDPGRFGRPGTERLRLRESGEGTGRARGSRLRLSGPGGRRCGLTGVWPRGFPGRGELRGGF